MFTLWVNNCIPLLYVILSVSLFCNFVWLGTRETDAYLWGGGKKEHVQKDTFWKVHLHFKTIASQYFFKKNLSKLAHWAAQKKGFKTNDTKNIQINTGICVLDTDFPLRSLVQTIGNVQTTRIGAGYSKSTIHIFCWRHRRYLSYFEYPDCKSIIYYWSITFCTIINV